MYLYKNDGNNEWKKKHIFKQQVVICDEVALGEVVQRCGDHYDDGDILEE